MKTIRFLQTRTPDDGSGRTFTAGSVHTMNDASADHWLSRKAAVEVDPADAKTARTAFARRPARRMAHYGGGWFEVFEGRKVIKRGLREADAQALVDEAG